MRQPGSQILACEEEDTRDDTNDRDRAVWRPGRQDVQLRGAGAQRPRTVFRGLSAAGAGGVWWRDRRGQPQGKTPARGGLATRLLLPDRGRADGVAQGERPYYPLPFQGRRLVLVREGRGSGRRVRCVELPGADRLRPADCRLPGLLLAYDGSLVRRRRGGLRSSPRPVPSGGRA